MPLLYVISNTDLNDVYHFGSSGEDEIIDKTISFMNRYSKGTQYVAIYEIEDHKLPPSDIYKIFSYWRNPLVESFEKYLLSVKFMKKDGLELFEKIVFLLKCIKNFTPKEMKELKQKSLAKRKRGD